MFRKTYTRFLNSICMAFVDYHQTILFEIGVQNNWKNSFFFKFFFPPLLSKATPFRRRLSSRTLHTIRPLHRGPAPCPPMLGLHQTIAAFF